MTTLDDETIRSALADITGVEQVVTDHATLQQSSVDFYRKYPRANGVFPVPLPTAIVYPATVAEVSALLKYANDNGINVIARTGNSSIERGLESAREPHIIVDGSQLDEIIKLDEPNMLLTVQAGVPLKIAEDFLNERGFTTGHLPQSQPLADFGGLVATRSIGQLSTYYGGIEDMLVGLEAVMADGRVIRIKNVPRRATGPDIRHIFMGSEGTIAFITEVTVKIFPYNPTSYHYLAYTVPDMASGFGLLRAVVVAGYRPSVVRLYNPFDWSQFYPDHADRPVVIFRTEGPRDLSAVAADAIDRLAQQVTGIAKYPDMSEIENWFTHLTWGPAEIKAEADSLAKTPFVGFTTEIAAGWSDINAIFEAVVARVKAERPNMFDIGGHSSHSYQNGTNLYFVYAFVAVDVAPEDEMAALHDPINRIIVEETLKRGGTIAHHHGIGKARAPYIKDEYGTSYPILKTLLQAFDPKNTMNAGNIIPLDFWAEKDD